MSNLLEVALFNVWHFFGTIVLIITIGLAISLPVSVYFRNKQLQSSNLLKIIKSKLYE
jgi:hypothetical protein